MAVLPPNVWRQPNRSTQLEQPRPRRCLHLFLVIILLIVWNVTANQVVPAGGVPISGIVGVAALVAPARAAGVGGDYLGLDFTSGGQGITVGLAGAGAVIAGVIIAFIGGSTPPTRRAGLS